MNSNQDQKKMQFHSVLAEAAYLPNNQEKFEYIKQYYGDQYTPIDKHTDKHHITVMDKDSGRVHIGIRGTDITNAQSGKAADLRTDALVSLGLHKLSNRYKKSDSKVKQLIKEYGKDNISIAGHSLGGTIASELSHKHGVESHAFNRGGTLATFAANKYTSLHPAHKERAKLNNVYYSTPSLTKGIDPLSIATSLDPLANIKFIQQKKLPKDKSGALSSHSLYHFHPELPSTQQSTLDPVLKEEPVESKTRQEPRSRPSEIRGIESQLFS